MYKSFFKRFFDIFASALGIIILSPILLVAMIGLSIANKGTPFFLQIRPGKNEKLFRIVKFKTMTDDRDTSGNLLPDEMRLTKIGSLVRKTSVDEIPQLLNVLKGDMSLIGPRPLLPEYLPLYNAIQRKRHHVRPGITGWAQVNGRNAISWTRKFELDVEYVEHLNFLFDLKIFFLTIKKVIVREGISQEGQATMDVFKGNN